MKLPFRMMYSGMRFTCMSTFVMARLRSASALEIRGAEVGTQPLEGPVVGLVRVAIRVVGVRDVLTAGEGVYLEYLVGVGRDSESGVVVIRVERTGVYIVDIHDVLPKKMEVVECRRRS